MARFQGSGRARDLNGSGAEGRLILGVDAVMLHCSETGQFCCGLIA
jgi:hypothetical protein